MTSAGGGRDTITAYVDGACSGNPGPGGWGVLLAWGEHERTLQGGASETTNNRMELTAAIRALEALNRPSRIAIYTDSTYLKDGITKWIHRWRANGWRTAERKPVKNTDLWQALADLLARHDVAWHWVRGHAGHDGNERADALARAGMAPFRPAKSRSAG
ncbi:MAG: ribonuclease HI [Alphaproteobacteria bacterium]|nr:ribonuclease HI [Alphaproteobacteria bacterium]